MRFMACRIDASLQERYCKRNDSFLHVALGIGAASFWSAAEKDIAESPTRSGTPRKV